MNLISIVPDGETRMTPNLQNLPSDSAGEGNSRGQVAQTMDEHKSVIGPGKDQDASEDLSCGRVKAQLCGALMGTSERLSVVAERKDRSRNIQRKMPEMFPWVGILSSRKMTVNLSSWKQ